MADSFRLCLASCMIKPSRDPVEDWKAHSACVQARNCYMGPDAADRQKSAGASANRSQNTKLLPAAAVAPGNLAAKNPNAKPIPKQAKDLIKAASTDAARETSGPGKPATCFAYNNETQVLAQVDCNGSGPQMTGPSPQASPRVSAEAISPEQPQPPLPAPTNPQPLQNGSPGPQLPPRVSAEAVSSEQPWSPLPTSTQPPH